MKFIAGIVSIQIFYSETLLKWAEENESLFIFKILTNVVFEGASEKYPGPRNTYSEFSDYPDLTDWRIVGGQLYVTGMSAACSAVLLESAIKELGWKKFQWNLGDAGFNAGDDLYHIRIEEIQYLYSLLDLENSQLDRATVLEEIVSYIMGELDDAASRLAWRKIDAADQDELRGEMNEPESAQK